AAPAAPSAGFITVAHRGASDRAPENTMAAFRKAAGLGVDMIEFDVRMSRDGAVVVIHDAKVNRTTDGKGKVGRLTLRQLRTLDAGSWFGAGYRGEKIPLLEEVLDAFAGTTGLLIDLKSPRLYPGIESALARAVKARGLDRRATNGVILQSADKRALQRIKKLMPQAPTALLIENPRRVTAGRLLEYREFADALHPRASGLTSFFVERAHLYGLKVIAWDANGQREVAALLRAGVDGIITADPGSISLPAESNRQSGTFP
ncbi:glycerophosphodiester phosphodiesterase, partial [Paenibacillus darwinianus]